jgi:uncharacterized membrane protein
VLAIAITLLIIEIKAPHIAGHSHPEEVRKIMAELIPKFVAFFVSFLVIAIYWKAHHYLFGYITGYTDGLIWIKTLFLLTIVLMPFSSAFYSENFSLNLAYSIYCFNIFLTGVLNCWLIRYISSGKRNISLMSGNVAWRKYHTLRSLVAPCVFLLSLLLSFYSAGLSRLSFVLIFPIIYYLNFRYKQQEKKVVR